MPCCRAVCDPRARLAHQGALPVEPVGDDLDVLLARGAGDAAATHRLEAELGEHPGGSRVVGEVRGGEGRQPRIGEAVAHHGAAGFRRVAMPPPRPPEPEAELGDAGGPAVEAHAADQTALPLDAETHLAPHRPEPAHRLRGREGIGDVARHGGNGPVAGEARELVRIGVAEGAQDEAFCLELRHLSRPRSRRTARPRARDQPATAPSAEPLQACLRRDAGATMRTCAVGGRGCALRHSSPSRRRAPRHLARSTPRRPWGRPWA